LGISEAIRAVPRLLRLREFLVETIFRERPAAVVLVDSPDFHLPLAKRLSEKGYRGHIHYIAPPTVWAWRRGRTELLRRYVHRCFPLFAFENAFLNAQGVRSSFLGHPLLDETWTSRRAAAPLRKVVLLPGSRRSEVERLLPVLLQVAKELRRKNVEPFVSVAPALSEEVRRHLADACRDIGLFGTLSREGEPAVFRVKTGSSAVSGDSSQCSARALLAEADAAVGACGTVAVEALLQRRFMVVLYKGSWMSNLVYRTCVHTPFVAVPNLLCGRAVYPELLQDEARPERILEVLDQWNSRAEVRKTVNALLERGRAALGAPGAARFWARTMLEDLRACSAARFSS
jgi:lipid-A-disaccharide synthase